jgi:amidohydrolase
MPATEPSTATAIAGSTNDSQVDRWLDAHTEGLIAFRRNLHAHPELSGHEHATTEFVRERLEIAGLTTRTWASGTGLVCDLDPATPGAEPMQRLALRADLDALAMHDRKDVAYRSQVDGVAHACGHDVHTSIVLGTALYFAHHRELVPGPLRFIFQPAEERVPGGALDVIADGGLDGVGAVIGMHCDPKLEVGKVGLKAGAISSAADMMTITLSGPGGHTARPELTVDLVTVAATIVTTLPGLVRSALSRLDASGTAADDVLVKVVFGSFHAGDAANVIPTRCELRASVRTPSLDVWETLPDVVATCLNELIADSGAAFELDYVHGVPPVVNDAHIIDTVHRTAERRFGDDAIRAAVQSWGGDDFAWFTRERPGAYVRLGVHDPDGGGPMLDLHAGHFDVDERSIAIGVRLLCGAVDDYFGPAVDPADDPTVDLASE